jgi:predicted AAA+ superfamily ATPase
MLEFFDRDEVLGVLHGFNPWWLGQESVVPSFRRLAYQACRRYLDDRTLRRAVLLSGPRRVGKTTILTQVAGSLLKEKLDSRSIFFVSLDHPLLKLLTLPKILHIYHESIYPVGKPVVLLLDEVQYSKDWELQVKQLVDHKPEYRIVATGSASVVHRHRLAESGVGRWITVPVPTLSFFEFLQIRDEAPPDIDQNLRPKDLFSASAQYLEEVGGRFRSLMPLFLRYLLVGGFPETAKQTDIALSQRLLREDVVERVLKRDMTALFGIRSVNELEKLFIYLCLHTGGIFSVQTCASALGTSATTISNHLEALQQANLIYRLPPAATGGKKRLKARYKIYLVDAALRNAVLLRGEEILSRPDELGTIVETTVLRHLYAYHYQDSPELVYWRDTASAKEVDIIVRSPSYTIPVEVKYRDDGTLAEKEGIVAYCKLERVAIAYWVTRRETDFGQLQFPGLETRFMRVPAHIFTYLLGQAERLLWTSPP